MKLTLGKKLGMGFGVILLCTTVSSVVVYVEVSGLAQNQVVLLEDRVPTLAAA